MDVDFGSEAKLLAARSVLGYPAPAGSFTGLFRNAPGSTFGPSGNTGSGEVPSAAENTYIPSATSVGGDTVLNLTVPQSTPAPSSSEPAGYSAVYLIPIIGIFLLLLFMVVFYSASQ